MTQHHSRLHPTSRFAILVMAILGLFVPGFAAKFDIAAQPAPAALKVFNKQSDKPVVYINDEVRDITTNQVQGEMESAEALAKLIAGTNLAISRTTEKNFVIASTVQRPGSVDGAVRDESGKPVMGAKILLSDSDKMTVTDKRGRFSIENVPAGSHSLQIAAEGLQNTRVTDIVVKPGMQHSLSPITIPVRKEGTLQLEDFVVSAKKNDGVVELDPYEVSGSKSKAFSTANIDLTRTKDDVLPFNVFTARDIESSGAANLADFFRTRLSQNFQSNIPEEVGGALGGANLLATQNQINFRGLGANSVTGSSELVVLVNGRRLPGIAPQGSNEVSITGNFRGIPTGSIDRIEVLSSAASAIYGAGATSGVINIVTKTDYKGGSLTLHYENPMKGYAPKRSAELSFASPLKFGFGMRFTASYSDRTSLSLEDRADVTAERWRNAIIARSPSNITSLFSPPLGATTNIVSANSTVGLFGPGSPTFTSVPNGYAGGQGLAPFLSRQGTLNLELADMIGLGSNSPLNYGKKTPFGPNSRDEFYSFGLDRVLFGGWRLSVDYTRLENLLIGQSVSFDQNLSVPAAAPTNPFGVNVQVKFSDQRLARPEDLNFYETASNQLTASIRGNVGEWRAIADFFYGKDCYESRQRGFLAPLGFNGSFSNALALGFYNPFVDTRVALPMPLTNYEEYEQRRLYSTGAIGNYQISAKASGPLFGLPAGAVQLTGGVEWLRQKRLSNVSENERVNSRTGDLFQRILTLSDLPFFTVDTAAIYSEAEIPVIAKSQHVPFASKLDLFGSGRVSSQDRRGFQFVSQSTSTIGNVLTVTQATRPVSYEAKPYLYAAGLRWDIVDGVAFRFSKSIGFRPPSFGDISPANPPTVSTNVTDRRTGQLVTLSSAQYVTGGNPGLDPETSNSGNFGVIFEPRRVAGLRISANYLENKRTNAIASTSVQEILNLEVLDASIANLVQRTSSGAISFVDARTLNFREIAVKSLDLTVEQQIESVVGGRLLFTASASKNISYRVQTSNTAAAEEQVRNPNASFLSQQLQWNANAQLRWEGRQFTLGWSTNFFDKVLTRTSNLVAQGSDRTDWALEHDAFVAYRFSQDDSRKGWRSVFAELSVSLGVKNIFDREPRFWSANDGLGYLPYDSIMGRSVWLQVRKSF